MKYKITKIDNDNVVHVPCTNLHRVIFEGGSTYITESKNVADYFDHKIGYKVEAISDQ